MGPPTCDCFVSSTDVQEGAGPSGVGGHPTTSSEEQPQEDPQDAAVVGSVHTSPLEEVVEESVDLGQIGLIIEESSFMAGPSHTSTPIRGSPSASLTSRGTTSRGSPYTRSIASSAPRKATRKTRGVPVSVQDQIALD